MKDIKDAMRVVSKSVNWSGAITSFTPCKNPSYYENFFTIQLGAFFLMTNATTVNSQASPASGKLLSLCHTMPPCTVVHLYHKLIFSQLWLSETYDYN